MAKSNTGRVCDAVREGGGLAADGVRAASCKPTRMVGKHLWQRDNRPAHHGDKQRRGRLTLAADTVKHYAAKGIKATVF